MLMRPPLPAMANDIGRRKQRGLSLVELMVGIAVGLLVVAAASMLTATQLSDNRRMMLEMQVQQDLRAAMDTMSRDVRRSGARNKAYNYVWTEETPGVLSGVEAATVVSAASPGSIEYRYERQGVLSNAVSGFDLDYGRLRFNSPNLSGWSELTDIKALTVTGFTVAAAHQNEPTPPAPSIEQRIPCPKLCSPGNDTSCWPEIRVRQFSMSVTATATSDAAVTRSIQTVVRPWNDELVQAGASICPT